MSSLKDKLKALPNKPGVYLFKDRKGEILYVGKAKSLRKRVTSYFSKQPEIKTSILIDRLYDIDFIVTGSELDALILEDELVKKYRPRYNISLKDDKAYPFLKLTVDEEWPRLFLTRRKEKDGALYFGRYQGGMVREVIRLVKKLFPIRWCKESPLRKREQPCLYYRVGSCCGPCIGRISRQDYLALVNGIIALLEGKMAEALARLQEEMQKAAKNQNFEQAAYLRDRIKLLQKMIEGKELVRTPAPRVLSGINELKRELNLQAEPMRIEAFDISNIQGSNIVGSMVAFYGGLPLKSDYRMFKVRSVERKPNDVAAIYEVVRRRYTKTLARKLPLPDLVLVDGGPAQVNSGANALAEAKLGKMPIIGLAKREEEIFIHKKRKPLLLPRNSPALQLLQRMRDEAHRFAVSYHRRRREKTLYGG
ncbi:MAG: excinuclease ABC subunit UvrC [Candidatus Margulisbacteria bacterium]|nr:excinuclease ABC subunit UvrC [Candidatus Margulisiibacteriota bacterium]